MVKKLFILALLLPCSPILRIASAIKYFIMMTLSETA